MIKKILFFIGVLFSFFLMFLFGLDKITILAYSDIGNALGSYPVKLDIDNYNTTNLLNEKNYLSEYNTYSNNTGLWTTASSRPGYNTSIFTNQAGYTANRDISKLPLVLSGDYTLTIYIVTNYSNSDNLNIAFYDNSGDIVNEPISKSITNNVTFNFELQNNLYLDIRVEGNSGYITFKGIQLSKGNEELPYSTFFEFGYNVNYSLAVNNLSSSQVNAGIAITDGNGNYLKTGSCVIPAGSSTICSNINEPLYLPFNIDNNGYISFDYSLGLFIGPVGLLSVTPNDSGLNFVPVFSAYYNGSPTDNLYFKDRYTFNNLFLSGFNVSVNSSTLSRVIFPRTQVDSEYSMNSNKIVNFATDKRIETGIYNYINYVDFINSSPNDIYSFVITTGVSSPGLFNNRIYTISFSNFSLKVNGDSSNSSPLPNNPSTINKYNECSAWYDIPCQLGNGLTYVIYEAPIISPVLTFIVSFITMFSSLVSFVDLFQSFGIVFGCFIIYMFIELLHKYSK